MIGEESMHLFRPWPVALYASLATLLMSSAAFACSCGNVDVAPEDFLREVDMMFAGTMVSKRPGDTEGCREGCTIGTFRVESPLKGKLGETVEIWYSSMEGTTCEWGLPMSKRVTVAAYGDSSSGYYAGHCSQYIVQQGRRSGEIWDLAVKNRERTDKLARFDKGDKNAQLKLLQWLSEYRSNEEGLDAADRLLALEPKNREALLFKEGFLSDLGRDAEALGISDGLLAHDTADATAAHRRALALVRLGRMSEIPQDWRNFDGLQAEGADFSNRKLSHATFRKARIGDFKFTNADLSQADFSGTSFNGADFKGANLAGANFEGVDGVVDLSGANVSGANFTSANLGWVLLVDTTAQGAILTGSCMEGDFKGVDLTGADLRNAQLRSGYWGGASLRNADLRAALLGASVVDIDVAGARYNDFTWPAPADLQRHGAVRVDDADPGQPPLWLPCPRPSP
jgi:uncharacterized protein YjbI with pentapeptide repeats